jgi:hypothetical protein
MKLRSALFAVAFGLLVSFTASADDLGPSRSDNPPPTSALSAFQRFESAPIVMGAPWAGQKGNDIAKDKLQDNLDLRLKPLLAEWNAKEAGETPRTLRIEPTIKHIRFITGGKRFWGGAFAGGSSILVSVKLIDATSGEVVAEPEFYQHANAMGAAWSFGATDKTMLIRISNMVTEYVRNNYAQAVGGSVSVAPEIDN